MALQPHSLVKYATQQGLSHCPVTTHSISQRRRKACQTTVYSHVNAGSSGALYTELRVQHSERATVVPKLIFSFCLDHSSLLQFSTVNKSRVLFHVIRIRSHNKMLGVLKVVFISMFFPACIITLVGNVTLSNASFKFSEVEPSLIILRSKRDLRKQFNRQQHYVPTDKFCTLSLLLVKIATRCNQQDLLKKNKQPSPKIPQSVHKGWFKIK